MHITESHQTREIHAQLA